MVALTGPRAEECLLSCPVLTSPHLTAFPPPELSWCCSSAEGGQGAGGFQETRSERTLPAVRVSGRYRGCDHNTALNQYRVFQSEYNNLHHTTHITLHPPSSILHTPPSSSILLTLQFTIASQVGSPDVSPYSLKFLYFVTAKYLLTWVTQSSQTHFYKYFLFFSKLINFEVRRHCSGTRGGDLIFDLPGACTATLQMVAGCVSSDFSHIRYCCSNLWSRKPPPRWILEQVVCLGLTFLTDISHRHTVTLGLGHDRTQTANTVNINFSNNYCSILNNLN